MRCGWLAAGTYSLRRRRSESGTALAWIASFRFTPCAHLIPSTVTRFERHAVIDVGDAASKLTRHFLGQRAPSRKILLGRRPSTDGGGRAFFLFGTCLT